MLIIINKINGAFINFKKQGRLLADLGCPLYLIIFELSLNYLVSLISFHSLFKTS